MVPSGGGDPPGDEHLPRPRHGPALPVHVPTLGRGGPRVLEHSGRACDNARAGTSALGGLDRGGRAVGLAGDRRQGQGHAAASAARRRAVTLHHRPDPQHLSAGPAEPDAADAAAGGLCLPAAGREAPAGVLVATAAAIKAFPILALGYFVYRRMWRAALATVAALLVWLLVVPLPFRTPAQAMADLAVWSRGMVFTYNAHGIAQRPYRSFSYKNQSIMALAHRLLRDVPADGETVLSQHITKRRQRQPVRGMLADGSIDLAAMLTAPTEISRWDDQYEGVEAALKQAWRVNVAALDFRTVTAITLAAMLALSLFVVAVLPARRLRTAHTDALEFALITLLIVMFSPLSFNYAFVWLIYPLSVALNLVLNEPARGPWRTLEIAWIASIFLIPGLAIVMPLYAQAYGNLFVPALLLVIGLGVRVRAMQETKLVGSKAYSRAAHIASKILPHPRAEPDQSQKSAPR